MIITMGLENGLTVFMITLKLMRFNLVDLPDSGWVVMVRRNRQKQF